EDGRSRQRSASHRRRFLAGTKRKATLSSAGRQLECSRSPFLFQKTVCKGVPHELGTGRQAELLHDVRPMRLGGPHGDVEHLRDLLVRMSKREEAQHLALAV